MRNTMSSSPSRKKQRTSVKEESEPETVASSVVETESAVDRNVTNNVNDDNENVNIIMENNTDDEEEKAVLSSLRGIFHSSDAIQALLHMTRLDNLLDGADKEVIKTNAQKIVDLQGLSTIILSMEKYKQSVEFVEFALRSLVQITYYLPQTKKLIVNWDTIPIMMDTSISKTSSIVINEHIIGLFYNISNSENTIADVSMSEIIDFVMKAMKQYPNKSYLQENGCKYLYNIMEVEGKKKELKKKDVASLLAKVHDNFQDKNDKVRASAERASKFLWN